MNEIFHKLIKFSGNIDLLTFAGMKKCLREHVELWGIRSPGLTNQISGSESKKLRGLSNIIFTSIIINFEKLLLGMP